MKTHFEYESLVFHLSEFPKDGIVGASVSPDGSLFPPFMASHLKAVHPDVFNMFMSGPTVYRGLSTLCESVMLLQQRFDDMVNRRSTLTLPEITQTLEQMQNGIFLLQKTMRDGSDKVVEELIRDTFKPKVQR